MDGKELAAVTVEVDKGDDKIEKSSPKSTTEPSDTSLTTSPKKADVEAAKEDQEPGVPYHELLLSNADKFDKLLMLAGTLGSVGNGMCWPIFAIIFAQFTDVFGGTSDHFMKDVQRIALNFLYLAIGAMFASYLQSAMWMWAGHRQAARLREHYLASVLKQDMGYFDTQASTGFLLQGLNEDVNTVQAALSEKVGHFLQHSTTFVAGIIIAFVGGWDMTLLMIGMMPILAAVGSLLAKVTVTTTTKINKAYTEASQGVQQSLSQIRTVAAYNGEERSLKAYEEALVIPTKINIIQSAFTGAVLGSVNFTMYCTDAAAFFYGAWRVSTGHYTGGQVMQVFIAALIGGFSLGQAAPVFEVFAKGKSAGARLMKVIKRKPAIDLDDVTGKELEKVEGKLELRDVVFAYPVRPETRIFNGFNLVVPAGKTVALVGSSGSGKSTVVQLIERFYDPQSGAVLLDGVNLKDLSLRWLRQQVGLVSQEPTLFATTIFENIAMGKPGATQAEVEAAAKAANAHVFITHLPNAYSTQVGERGLQMSGGQKQRIAIARAILKNPKIMLLDEATSALDTHSERVVQAALDNMIVGRTTVVVAHRLSTIQGADLIAVVRAGEVVEQGSHAELIANPTGAYTTLVKLQMQAAEKAKEDQEEAGEADGDEDALDIPDTVLEIKEEELIEAAQSGEDRVTAQKTVSIELGARRASADDRISIGRKGSADDRISIGRKGSVEASRKLSMELPVKEGDGKKKPAAPPVNVPFSRLLALNKPEIPYGFGGLIGSIINGAIQPAFAFILSSFIVLLYQTAPDRMLHDASFYSWMFFVVGSGALIGSTVQQLMFGKMGAELARRVRLMMYNNMLHQEIGWFDLEENSSGVLTTKLVTDASYVRGAVGDTLGLMTQNLVTLVVGYVIAFVYDWRMALLITGALPFMIGGSVLYYKSITGTNENAAGLAGPANQAVSDAFTSVRVVQAYNLQNHMTSLYNRLMAEANGKAKKQSHILGLLMGYSQMSIFSVYALIIYFGGVELDSGRVGFNGFLKSFLALLMAAMGIAQAQIGFPDIGKAKEAIQSIFPIIDRKAKIDSNSTEGRKEGPGGSSTIEGAIELKNVHFAYPARPSVIVFKGFNLDIPAGKTVALVGESGSGKSTIVGLALRYYDVLDGVVNIDGADIRSYNLAWLRSQIGLVSQEPLLFSRSVLENIRYGKPDASMDEVEAAARAANAYDFIMALPEGFNTEVGERGVQLSGGQKQRVAIARAVLKNPKIMLLDEATSALDAHSERVVQDALDTIMIGRTSVVVAHRLSTIRNADKIALVYRGQVLEQGTHNELMAIPEGGYARLVAAQNGGEQKTKTPGMTPSSSKMKLATDETASPKKQ